MKVLNVFVLTVLCCSRGEGRIVSKCELREQLVKAIGNLTSGVSDDNLVATFICRTGLVSGFNTSAVKEVINGEQERNSRGRRNVHESQSQSSATKPLPSNRPWTTKQALPSSLPTPHISLSPNHPSIPHRIQNPNHPSIPHHMTGPNDLCVLHPPSNSKPKPSINPPLYLEPKPSGQPPATHPVQAQQSPQDGNDGGISMLYGLFQLSNHQACSDGTDPSANICGLGCSKLVDDDISDDISCMLKVTSVERTVASEEGCRNVQASDYVAACP